MACNPFPDRTFFLCYLSELSHRHTVTIRRTVVQEKTVEVGCPADHDPQEWFGPDNWLHADTNRGWKQVEKNDHVVVSVSPPIEGLTRERGGEFCER